MYASMSLIKFFLSIYCKQSQIVSPKHSTIHGFKKPNTKSWFNMHIYYSVALPQMPQRSKNVILIRILTNRYSLTLWLYFSSDAISNSHHILILHIYFFPSSSSLPRTVMIISQKQTREKFCESWEVYIFFFFHSKWSFKPTTFIHFGQIKIPVKFI